MNILAIDELKTLTNYKIDPVIATEKQVLAAHALRCLLILGKKNAVLNAVLDATAANTLRFGMMFLCSITRKRMEHMNC